MEHKHRDILETLQTKGAVSDRDLLSALKKKGFSHSRAQRMVRARNQLMNEHYNQW